MFWNNKKIQKEIQNQKEILKDKISLNKNKKFKILSIDGGGLKGYFTLFAIQKLQEEEGIDFLEEFDMFVGTSTGSLIILSIILKEDLKELLNLYKGKPNIIFSQKKELRKQLKSLFFSRYENNSLIENLKKILKDMTFEELDKIVKKPYIFTGTNLTEAKPIIFSSKHFNSVNERYKKLKVWEAIYTSTAAPFYFEPFLEEYTKDILLDGGIWANNPSNVALTFAMGDLNHNIENILLLSFGQTYTENIKININRDKSIMKTIGINQFSSLFSSSLVSRQNYDSFSTMILLKEKLFRYAPLKDFKGNKLNYINKEFINYSEEFYIENKESLIKFIKYGKNANYSIYEKKRFN